MPTVTSIANQAVFDLPWLVAQEAGLFAQEGLEVVFLPQTPWEAHRPLETDPGQVPPFWQYTAFEAQAATAFNACEWGQVRRVEASTRGGRIVTLRPALVSQAIVVRPERLAVHANGGGPSGAQTITTPPCRRAMPWWHSGCGCGTSSGLMRWSTWAPTARSNGCRAKP